MKHRHLYDWPYLTLSAIDDIIERGKRNDWVELRDAAKRDPEVMAKIRKICAARCVNPYAQRYHLWRVYA